MLIHKLTKPISLAIGVFSCCLLATIPTRAQVSSDGTVSTSVETTDNENFTITGGERAGDNLFHSFEEFSVPNGGSASFDNAPTIQNIFSRVTGGSASDIDGLIEANGSANLFLINPNGIIFGENARLDIRGSFLATTADRIDFPDTQFSAVDTQTEPLLSVNVPIGLQFGERPERIVNRSIGFGSDGFPDRLAVGVGKTLALVGGDIEIDGGGLRAPGGRIELGSVGSFSFVDLTQISEGWALGYEQVQEFQNIQLSQAFVDTTDLSGNIPSGSLQLYGRAITIADQSRLGGVNLATQPGGTLFIKATEFLSINPDSSLSTSTFSNGKAGDIEIEIKQLLVSNGSTISSSSEGEGRGGNIIINASDSVEVIGSNSLTLLSTRANQSGNAGEINITTGKLIIQDGGQISSSSFGEGDGGSVTVNASESVEISGQREIEGREGLFGSALFAQTTTRKNMPATGDGGTITVNTKSLNIQDGGRISVGSVNGSEGAAGTLKITASESININGSGSTLLAESQSSQPAGDLIINTNRLTVTDRGEVNVSATGTGVAGNLTITTQDITLDEGTLTAETNAGNQGNITINNENNLLLRNNSQITTNAQGTATGGDITINSDIIAAVNNSDITANAVEGRGGDISITAQLVGIEAREEESPNTNDITASSELGVDGTITIDNPNDDPLKGLLNVPSVPLDAARIFAQNVCKFEDGKIAKGSSLIITGRGGFVLTAADSIDNRDRVVNWAKRDDIKVSEDGSVAVRQRSEQETLETSDRVIQQAQGLVIASDGTAWLTAQSPNITLQNSGTDHPDCRS